MTQRGTKIVEAALVVTGLLCLEPAEGPSDDSGAMTQNGQLKFDMGLRPEIDGEGCRSAILECLCKCEGALDGSLLGALEVQDDPTGHDRRSPFLGVFLAPTVDRVKICETVLAEDSQERGTLVVTTANDGAYTDQPGLGSGDSYVYTVCDEGSSTCSNEVTVSF